MRKVHGFTLIELLIVVAIIAILAAIAVPNFLEAQTRSKVSRAKADMYSISVALEAYLVDQNRYPQYIVLPTEMDDIPSDVFGFSVGYFTLPDTLTTPVAYMTSIPNDPFWFPKRTHGDSVVEPIITEEFPVEVHQRFQYLNLQQMYQNFPFRQSKDFLDVAGGWILYSQGPSRDTHSVVENPQDLPNVHPRFLFHYDPSNGTVSQGIIARTQKSSEGKMTW